MTADNPIQARRLEQALPLIQSKMAELKQTIDLRRTEGLDSALKVVLAGQGKVFMDNIRQIVVAMDDEERNSLRVEKTRSDFSANLSETTIISASLLAFVLTGLVGWYLTSSLTRQIGSAAALSCKALRASCRLRLIYSRQAQPGRRRQIPTKSPPLSTAIAFDLTALLPKTRNVSPKSPRRPRSLPAEATKPCSAPPNR